MSDMHKAQILQYYFQNTILRCPRLSETSTHGWYSREELKKTGHETEYATEPKGDPSPVEQQLGDSQYILTLKFTTLNITSDEEIRDN